MKALFVFFLAVVLTTGNALAERNRIYRCGNEYFNSVPEGQESKCKLISDSEPDIETSGGEPDPAKWIEIGVAANGNVVYASKPPFQKEGRLIKRWTLWNLKKIAVDSSRNWYLSVISLDLFNCGTRVSGTRQATRYSLHSGQGEVVKTIKWEQGEIVYEEPVPGTIGETLIEMTCEKGKAAR